MKIGRRAEREMPEEELLARLDPGRLPVHVAIIMDGNGRWARRRGLARTFGHRAGVEALREVVRACSQLGIGVLTVYAFSTENWKRPREEIDVLMQLLGEYLERETPELQANRVRLLSIGCTEELPRSAQEQLRRAQETTAANDGLALVLAINYGGRAEIARAARRLAELVQGGGLRPEAIDERVFAGELYTAGLPDPDLLIRPAGEMRLSNFLLWQAAYAELWVTDVYWPDFRRRHLLEALLAYQGRERRFGGLPAR